MFKKLIIRTALVTVTAAVAYIIYADVMENTEAPMTFFPVGR